ncbi:MAG: hypothetical protein DRP42_00675 [Tenericutes bacterium]|nr:MAG: hypothetical protein DRP42_00675 [Mycoplasmatota bacterium]
MSLVDTYEKIAMADAERFEKLAEEDAAGRIMARGFMDELNKLAAPIATAVQPRPPARAARENAATLPGPAAGGPRQMFNSGLARSSGPSVSRGAAPTTRAVAPRVNAPAAAAQRPAINTGGIAAKRGERSKGNFLSSLRSMKTRALNQQPQRNLATSSGPKVGGQPAPKTAPAQMARPKMPGVMR